MSRFLHAGTDWPSTDPATGASFCCAASSLFGLWYGGREKSGIYCYEAVHQQSRRDGGRREGGGGYGAVARFTRGEGVGCV